MNALGLAKTADAARFDVDDARRADRDGFSCVFDAVDRFVETDRRADLLLQRRVIDDVVVRERLLDHHRSRFVDLLEQRRVLERVGGVRVEHEIEIRKFPPDALRDLQVHTGPYLQLDA